MTSSLYVPYTKMKNSGQLALGMIPSHWRVIAIKRLGELQGGAGFPHNFQGIENEEIGFYKVNSLGAANSNGYLTKATDTISRADAKELGAFIFSPGAIVFAKVGAALLLGRIRRTIAESCIDNNMMGLIIYDVNNSTFIKYCMDTINFDLIVNPGAVPSINESQVGAILFAVPPKSEQTQIANFLDHETAKIDRLIEKQQELIKLLKEKRQAVISHAVTKGLNPDAPMKDSGVEWLGEVPAHWEVSKLGYVSSVVRGGSPRPAGDPTLFNGDYSPWVTVAEITKDDDIYLTKTETCLTKKGSDQCRVFSSGTLLFSNSGATLGVPKILNIDANANDGVVGFEHLKLNHEFVYFYLSSLTDDLRERIKQGSGQPNLNTDIVKDIEIPIPPQNEIDAIVFSIHKAKRQYQTLSQKVDKGIELLQERRTALISAAVTGKIDVRNWQPPESNS